MRNNLQLLQKTTRKFIGILDISTIGLNTLCIVAQQPKTGKTCSLADLVPLGV